MKAMKATAKIFSSLLIVMVYTFGAVMPSFGQTSINGLTGNYLTIHRGFYRAGANSQNTHRMRVRRGQQVRVRINGDDDTDLDLFVYDPQGRLVGQDLSLDDNETVSFRARTGGIYTIRVSNLGDVWNQYSISF